MYQAYFNIYCNDEITKVTTFGRKHTVLIVSSVQHLSIELFWDYVDSWDLVVPCAVANHEAITVCKILFIYEKPNSLYKGTFNLQDKFHG
jgi:hypothetical protein